MNYLTTTEVSKKWKISEQLVRRYCRDGRITSALCKDGAWYIPETEKKPERIEHSEHTEELPPLAQSIQSQRKLSKFHGLYDYIQINLTYSSSRLASNRLKREQIESLFLTGKINVGFEPLKVSDCIEALNHMACVDYIIDHAADPLTQKFIKQLHILLMNGTIDVNQKRVTPGEYRPKSFSIKGRVIPPSAAINGELGAAIREYENNDEIGLSDILDFHVQFESVAPFEDGNGRIGRLIMFKECLRHDVIPFVLDDKSRRPYLDGINKWASRRRSLIDLANKCQERFTKEIEHQKQLQSLERFKPGKHI